MPSATIREAELTAFFRRRRRRGKAPQTRPVGPFLTSTLDLAARLVPCEAGSVLLDDPELRRPRSPLTFVAAFGPAKDALVGVQVPAGRGIAGHVYGTGRSYVSNRVRQDPRFFRKVDRLAAFQTSSVIAVPIVLEAAVCGVLELVNRRGRRGFLRRDVELAELLAGTISRGILNAVDLIKQRELALIDDLTSLANSRGIDPSVARAIARARRERSDASLLFLDVDRLKRVNDRLGHAAGSATLQRVGEAIGASCRGLAEPFRFGGDEFVVVCPAMGRAEAEGLATRIREAVRRARPRRSALPPIEVSIGVAALSELPRGGSREAPVALGARWLRHADAAMYRDKRARRRRARG